MPKPFSLQSKNLIASLINYFQKERDNAGPLLPLTAVRERVASTLGISKNAVCKISATIKSGNSLSDPKPAKDKKRPITDLDKNQKFALRDAIYDMFEKKIQVNLDSILKFCKERFLFEGGRTSLHAVLHEMGFKWKKNNRKALMEQSYPQKDPVLRKYMDLLHDLNPKQFLYVDETWIFQNGCQTGILWQDDSHKCVKTLKSEWKRYCFACQNQRGIYPRCRSNIRFKKHPW